jgi:hypothetical protein
VDHAPRVLKDQHEAPKGEHHGKARVHSGRESISDVDSPRLEQHFFDALIGLGNEPRHRTDEENERACTGHADRDRLHALVAAPLALDVELPPQGCAQAETHDPGRVREQRFNEG